MSDAVPSAVADPENPGADGPTINVEGLTRTFGGLVAVDIGQLSFRHNAITALIGPNGAGKTTFFNLISGFDTPDSGQWFFGPRNMTGMAPHQIAQSGIVRTFQLTKALSRLTVLENMKLGAGQQTGERLRNALLRPLWRSQERQIEADAKQLLLQFKLDHLENELAANLSGGQRKLLELARALMAKPQVLLLDEPMAGVNPALAEDLLEHIKQIRDEGRTVIFVEHDMDIVRDISDWVVVLAEGRLVAQGIHRDIVTDDRVIDAYLGRHHDSDLEDIATEPTGETDHG